jgi:type I restriction enzyme S subunit
MEEGLEVPLESLVGATGVFTDGDWILSNDLTSVEDVRLLQLGDIGAGRFNDHSSKWISRQRFEELGCTPVLPGDILISRMAEPLARACRAPDLGHACITAVDVALLRVDETIADPAYVMRMLNSPAFTRRSEAVASGTTRKRISRRNLGALPIPLPPLEVQRNIREELETRLIDVDEGANALSRAAAGLEQFRAAIRRDACLGRLNAAQSRDVEDRDGVLPPLPAGWLWETVDELAAEEPRAITDGPFGSNLKTVHYVSEGPRVIRLQNIGDGEFIDIEAHITMEHFETLRAHEARPGDIVMAAMGEALPRACVVPDWLGPAIVKADCPRLRPRPGLDPEYLALALNSHPVRAQAARIIHGVGRPRLNLKEVKALKLPVAPGSVQASIVRTVNSQFEAAAELASQLRLAVTSGEKLRSALHHLAFARGLTPGEPAGQTPAA